MSTLLKVFLGVFGVLYAGGFWLSLRGSGYAQTASPSSQKQSSSYRPYYGPSFFYWGGIPTYHTRSMRAGSPSGPSVLGGGPHAGK